MKEKNFQVLFSKWAKEYEITKSIAFELKISSSKSLRFDAVKPHQREALLAVKNKGFYHKINDMPIVVGGFGMRFTNPKPFDAFSIRGDAYVVILFYKPKVKKRMFFVDIDKWIEEEKESPRKSITKERVEAIASFWQNI